MTDGRTTPEDAPDEDAEPRGLALRMALPAAGFYLAWSGLAVLSHVGGHTTLAPAAAGLLISAILITNVLLAVLNSPVARPAAEAPVATAQAGLAIAWTTVYAVLAEGPGELVPAMYLTAVLIAFTRTDAARLQQLALASGAGYALSLLVRMIVSGSAAAVSGEILQCIGVIGMLAVLARRAAQAEEHRAGLSAEVGRLRHEIERITRTAERDHLTKSFNRQYILEALLREKARADRTGRTFSICIFDLDHFKSLNDTHGHLVGDQVLTAFANRARRALRSMDAINPTRFRRALGRLGGEEFIALLPGTEVDGALRCAERVREAAARQRVGNALQITVSAGVAQYRIGESIPELLTRADQALYIAKRSGRNRVRVSTGQKPEQPPPEAVKPNLRVVR